MWSRPVAFVNAAVLTEYGEAQSVRFASKVLGLDDRPRSGDAIVDLDGAHVLPGLINAHDHLELNHYGRLKFRECYTNVSAWIDDMRPRLRNDPRIRAGQSYSLADRLFIGALKNLLSGVTTVAHHNPLYADLRRRFPVRVLRRYGWAHSFALEDQPAGARGEVGGSVSARYRATPATTPFFVHLAEGVDVAAREELQRLDRLECLGDNVVLVHGVGLDNVGCRRVVDRGAGLVWCPGSNLFLFNRTAPIRQFIEHATPDGQVRLALGTDSRLSGSRDLLEELRIASRTGLASPAELLAMVTHTGGRLLRQTGAGCIAPGQPADLVVIPRASKDAARSLLRAARRDVRLVVIGGRPAVGDPSLSAVFAARGAAAKPVLVDETPKLIEARLAGRIAGCAIREQGVEAA